MGFRLKVVAGPGLGTECALDGGELTIGRAPENGLVINDNNVSRVHARVTLAPGNRVVVADAGSRNGVYVNDRKVNQQPINPGDRVVVGQTVIELVADRDRAGSGRSPAAATPRGAVPGGGTAGRVRPNDGKAAVVPVRGNMARTGAVKPARAGGPKGEKKSGGSGLVLVGVIGIALLFGAAAVMREMNGGERPGSTSDVTATAVPSLTPPLFPGQSADIDLPSNEIEKLPKEAKQWVDIGDSQRTSGNLVQARVSFQNALRIMKGKCDSCSVRLEAVKREIDDKIADREKAGALAYEQGDYKRAADAWQIAVSYIGDANSPRAKTLKQKIDDAMRQVQTQPQ